MCSFNNIVDKAENHATHMIDTFDSNTVLKLYNLNVTDKDREAAKDFGDTVKKESKSYADYFTKGAAYSFQAICFLDAFVSGDDENI